MFFSPAKGDFKNNACMENFCIARAYFILLYIYKARECEKLHTQKRQNNNNNNKFLTFFVCFVINKKKATYVDALMRMHECFVQAQYPPPPSEWLSIARWIYSGITGAQKR